MTRRSSRRAPRSQRQTSRPPGGQMIYVDAVVLGGGMYGCKIAIALRSLGLDGLLLEPNRIPSGATAANQGRVHGGYHSPRSYHTAPPAQKYYRRLPADHAPA